MAVLVLQISLKEMGSLVSSIHGRLEDLIARLVALGLAHVSGSVAVVPMAAPLLPRGGGKCVKLSTIALPCLRTLLALVADANVLLNVGVKVSGVHAVPE